jgi:hypothetical protein
MYSDLYSGAYSGMNSGQQYTPDAYAAPTCTVRRAASLSVNRDAANSNSSSSNVAWSDDFDIDESDILDDDNNSNAADLSRIDKLVWEFEVSNITLLYYAAHYSTTESPDAIAVLCMPLCIHSARKCCNSSALYVHACNVSNYCMLLHVMLHCIPCHYLVTDINSALVCS